MVSNKPQKVEDFIPHDVVILASEPDVMLSDVLYFISPFEKNNKSQIIIRVSAF